jgi:hypothetical protein
MDQGHTFRYNTIAYIPLSTLCSIAELDRMWKQALDKSFAAELFPKYELFARSASNPQLPKIKLSDVHSGDLNAIPFDDVDIELVAEDKSIQFALASFELDAQIRDYVKADPIQTIQLGDNQRLIGIWVKVYRADWKEWKWTGFHWVKLRKQQVWIDPQAAKGEPGKPVSFVARTNGTAPKPCRFVWNFGDGTPEVSVNNDSAVTHSFANPGTFTVSVALYDAANARVSGAQSTATIGLGSAVDTAYTVEMPSNYTDGTPKWNTTAKGTISAAGISFDQISAIGYSPYYMYYAAVPSTVNIVLDFTVEMPKTKFTTKKSYKAPWWEDEFALDRSSMTVETNGAGIGMTGMTVDSSGYRVRCSGTLSSIPGNMAIYQATVQQKYTITRTSYADDGTVTGVQTLKEDRYIFGCQITFRR